MELVRSGIGDDGSFFDDGVKQAMAAPKRAANPSSIKMVFLIIIRVIELVGTSWPALLAKAGEGNLVEDHIRRNDVRWAQGKLSGRRRN